MKKLLILLLVVFSVNTFAQNVKYGIKGGTQLSNVIGDDSEADPALSYYVGGFMEFHVSEGFYFQPELVYNSCLTKVDDYHGEIDINISYLDIPFMLKLEATPNFRMLLGLTPGVLLNTKIKQGNVTVDDDDSFEDINCSVSVGFEYLLDEHIAINFRYNHGVTELESDFELFRQEVQAGLSFSF